MPKQRKKRTPKVKAETPVEETGKSNIVVPEKLAHWIMDEASASKKCDACGAVMKGWAYRELFLYCPKCGTRTV